MKVVGDGIHAGWGGGRRDVQFAVASLKKDAIHDEGRRGG
jgi:hypothetical protein